MEELRIKAGFLQSSGSKRSEGDGGKDGSGRRNEGKDGLVCKGA